MNNNTNLDLYKLQIILCSFDMNKKKITLITKYEKK